MELRLSDFTENPNQTKEKILEEILFRSLLELWAKENNIPSPKILLNEEEKKLFPKDKLKALKDYKNFKHLHQSLLKHLKDKAPEPDLKEQKEFYGKNKSFFREASKCQLKQILVDNKKLAQTLYKRLSKGESFNLLNKSYSLQDNPEWVEKGQLALFDKACFEQKEKISPVLKSPYGYHIFKREAVKSSRQKSFSESQQRVISLLKEKELALDFQNWLKEETSKKSLFKDKKLLDKIKIQYKKENL